jgi:hypothetical protein
VLQLRSTNAYLRTLFFETVCVLRSLDRRQAIILQQAES